jgi:hypothetical protein
MTEQPNRRVFMALLTAGAAVLTIRHVVPTPGPSSVLPRPTKTRWIGHG